MKKETIIVSPDTPESEVIDYISDACEKLNIKKDSIVKITVQKEKEKRKTLTIHEIIEKFDIKTNKQKVKILAQALDIMQPYNGIPKTYCVAIAMGYSQTLNHKQETAWIKRKKKYSKK